MNEIIVGIDIGTSKVCTLIGKLIKQSNRSSWKGIDSCTGVKKGIIVDIESTSNAIKKSVEQAETMANLKLDQHM